MKDYTRPIYIATWVGIIVNTILAIIKAIGGFFSGSKALIADALHSASDIVGSIVVLFAVRIANKPPDEEHPYGHGKAENIASIIIAILLIIVGIEISISSIKVFFAPQPEAPTSLALYILIASIIIKEGLFYYKWYLGKKYQSSVLISEAWHHRSDSLSSLAALIGVGLAVVGKTFNIPNLVYADPIAGIIVSVIVMKVGYDLIKSSATIILEKVLSKDEIQHYKQTVLSVDGVLRIDQLFARTHGRYIIVDIKVSVDPTITVKEGHDIAAATKQALMKKHPEIEDVLVHINPYEPDSE